MKKGLIIALALACLLGLAGCDPSTDYLDGEEILDNTVKIELYDYENTNPKLVRLDGKNPPIFDFSKATFIAALDESLFEAVVGDIAKQELMLFDRSLNEPIGKTLILYQSDGNMIVLFSCIYKNERGGTRYYGQCNVYDENGSFVAYLGDISCVYVDTLESEYFCTSDS